MIISVPVQTAVWMERGPGTLVNDVVLQTFVAGV